MLSYLLTIVTSIPTTTITTTIITVAIILITSSYIVHDNTIPIWDSISKQGTWPNTIDNGDITEYIRNLHLICIITVIRWNK